MDSKLRAYLESPPPRSVSTGLDERLLALLGVPSRMRALRLPLGAALFGGLLVVQVIPSGERAWIHRGLVWTALVLLAYLVERVGNASRQRLLRTGTLESARVASQEVKVDGEDLLLLVVLEVLSEPRGGDPAYRAPRLPSHYPMTLTSRWLTADQKAPFEANATFPILTSARRDALVFLQDDVIEVLRAPRALRPTSSVTP